MKWHLSTDTDGRCSVRSVEIVFVCRRRERIKLKEVSVFLNGLNLTRSCVHHSASAKSKQSSYVYFLYKVSVFLCCWRDLIPAKMQQSLTLKSIASGRMCGDDQ